MECFLLNISIMILILNNPNINLPIPNSPFNQSLTILHPLTIIIIQHSPYTSIEIIASTSRYDHNIYTIIATILHPSFVNTVYNMLQCPITTHHYYHIILIVISVTLYPIRQLIIIAIKYFQSAFAIFFPFN